MANEDQLREFHETLANAEKRRQLVEQRQQQSSEALDASLIGRLIDTLSIAKDDFFIALFEATNEQNLDAIFKELNDNRDQILERIDKFLGGGSGSSATISLDLPQTQDEFVEGLSQRGDASGDLAPLLEQLTGDAQSLAELLGGLGEAGDTLVKAVGTFAGASAVIDESSQFIGDSARRLKSAADAMEKALGDIGARLPRPEDPPPGEETSPSPGLTVPVNLPGIELPGGISAVTGGGLSRGGAGGLVPDGDPVSEHFIARLREADDASWRFNDALVANRGSLERLGTTGERVFGDLTSVLRRFIEGGLAAANDNERTLYDAPARLVA